MHTLADDGWWWLMCNTVNENGSYGLNTRMARKTMPWRLMEGPETWSCKYFKKRLLKQIPRNHKIRFLTNKLGTQSVYTSIDCVNSGSVWGVNQLHHPTRSTPDYGSRLIEFWCWLNTLPQQRPTPSVLVPLIKRKIWTPFFSLKQCFTNYK